MSEVREDLSGLGGLSGNNPVFARLLNKAVIARNSVRT